MKSFLENFSNYCVTITRNCVYRGFLTLTLFDPYSLVFNLIVIYIYISYLKRKSNVILEMYLFFKELEMYLDRF